MQVGSFQLDLVELANALMVLFGAWMAYDARKKHLDKKRQEPTVPQVPEEPEPKSEGGDP